MEQRNLDFGIAMTPEQWRDLARAADTAGRREGGFDWKADDPDEIHVFLRNADAPTLWRDYVSGDDTYGAKEREVAQFRFNDGRPFAHIEVTDFAEQPVVQDAAEDDMRVELEQWVRGKWHELLRGSGLHFDRGHVPQG